MQYSCVKGKVTLETSSVMKHYVKESSLGRQMTLMGDVKCCINMLDFIGGEIVRFVGIRDSKIPL